MRGQKNSASLRHRKKEAPKGQQMSMQHLNGERENVIEDDEVDPGCCSRFSRWMQNTSYNWMAFTIWDGVVSGFKPGRVKAIQLLDIQPEDKVLFVGEGSGLDFECLPESLNRDNFRAFDFSPEMVSQSKVKARQLGIPEDNCFVGDAQSLPFTTEKFDKIYFPLSLASIPNPTLALQEAERVLAPGGKIVLFDKMADEDATIGTGRKALNLVTSSVFADINRKLPMMMGHDSPLKIIHYGSLANQLEGVFANAIGGHYRLAVLVRSTDYPEQPALHATLSH